MLTVIVLMIAILLVAGLVAAYVAYPHRGTPMPAAGWLGEAMLKLKRAMPLLTKDERAALRRS
ncbi:MAG: hypothetical protein ACRCYU_21000 [Nocardioides sp.]